MIWQSFFNHQQLICAQLFLVVCKLPLNSIFLFVNFHSLFCFRKILNFFYNIYIVAWLYYIKSSDTKFIVCASKEDVEIYSHRLRLFSNEVILMRDIKIQKSDVEHMNQYYKKHIAVVKSKTMHQDIQLTIILSISFSNCRLCLEIYATTRKYMYIKNSIVTMISTIVFVKRIIT